ncbi:nitroreductase family protein, partial [Acinetobacter baumannii]
PWRFLFVPSEKKEAFVEKLITVYPAETHPARREMYNQPAAYLIVIMPEDPRQKQWEEDFSAVCALIQNFQLLAWERNLGVVWKTNQH